MVAMPAHQDMRKLLAEPLLPIHRGTGSAVRQIHAAAHCALGKSRSKLPEQAQVTLWHFQRLESRKAEANAHPCTFRPLGAKGDVFPEVTKERGRLPTPLLGDIQDQARHGIPGWDA